MCKILLVKKYNPNNFFWQNLLNNIKIKELSLEQVLDKYKGFEGNLIAFFQENNKDLEIQENIKHCLKLKKSKDDCLLYVSKKNNKLLPPKFILVGYDVGICEKEKTIFSSIFNEILFGFFIELIEYKNSLNENFLFSNKNIANNYLILHEKLSKEGKGVEDYEKMHIYAVWKYLE
jgi:hypothetical protein